MLGFVIGLFVGAFIGVTHNVSLYSGRSRQCMETTDSEDK